MFFICKVTIELDHFVIVTWIKLIEILPSTHDGCFPFMRSQQVCLFHLSAKPRCFKHKIHAHWILNRRYIFLLSNRLLCLQAINLFFSLLSFQHCLPASCKGLINFVACEMLVTQTNQPREPFAGACSPAFFCIHTLKNFAICAMDILLYA